MLVPLDTASGIAFGSASLGCGKEKLPEIGFNPGRFLGGRKNAVRGTVLEAEEAQGFLDVWAAAVVPRAWKRRLPSRGLCLTFRHTPILSSKPGRQSYRISGQGRPSRTAKATVEAEEDTGAQQG